MSGINQPPPPPSDDFAAYLVSPYHQRRMEAGRARMMQRMTNFAPGETFCAISEALGAMAAIGEFYARLATPPRSMTARLTGDPLYPIGQAPPPQRSRSDLPHLEPKERAVLLLLSDRKPYSLADIRSASDSGGQDVTIRSAIAKLRAKVEPVGVVIDCITGRYSMDAGSAAIVVGLFGLVPGPNEMRAL